MSNGDRSEIAALSELERVLEHVKDELAAWRRRALKAEADRAEMGADHDVVASREQVKQLEAEKAEMLGRLGAARGRVDDLLARLKFLEQQAEVEEQNR